MTFTFFILFAFGITYYEKNFYLSLFLHACILSGSWVIFILLILRYILSLILCDKICDAFKLLIQSKFQINICIFRLVKMREGYSQVQLVLLANDKHRRGPRVNVNKDLRVLK